MRVSFKLAPFLLLIYLWVVPEWGMAETTTQAAKGEEPRKKHTLNFEDELIEGGVQKPELMYLLQRRNFNFKKLIRLREHFLPEMAETGELLRGSGRGT